MASTTSPELASSEPFNHFIDGHRIPKPFSTEIFRSAVNYKPRPDDVFIVTYPKCGTNWSQHTVALIFSQGEPLPAGMGFWTATPFLEITGSEIIEKLPRPVAIKSHLPYHMMPQSDAAKYIYVTRNPKDCCVSYFHHMLNVPGHDFYGTFDEFFEYFVSGKIDFGDYFDHLLGWYAHRNDPNVLLITFEEMKEQTENVILKMASFIDDKLYAEPLRKDPSKLQNIIKYSGLDYMKKTVNNAIADLFAMPVEDVLKSDLPDTMKNMILKHHEIVQQSESKEPIKPEFVRKGIIGDWKNCFTEEQSKRLQEKFAERTKGTDIPKLWEKYM